MPSVNKKAASGASGSGFSSKDYKAGDIYDSAPKVSSKGGSTLAKYAEENTMAPSFMIEGYLAMGPLNLLGGQSQTMKTGLSLHMACCMAAGVPFFGHRVTKAPVIYLAGEGSLDEFNNRIVAAMQRFRSEYHLEPMIAFKHGFFDLVHGREAVIEAAKKCSGDLFEEYRQSPGLLIFDTVPAMTLGEEENTSDGMGRIMAAMLAVGASVNCNVLGLVYPAEGNNKWKPRGHGSLFARADTYLFADGQTLFCRKLKGGEMGAPLGYRRRVVKLKQNISFVVDAAGAGPAQVPSEANPKLGKPAQKSPANTLIQKKRSPDDLDALMAAHLEKNPKASRRQLAQHFNASLGTVQNSINRLKAKAAEDGCKLAT